MSCTIPITVLEAAPFSLPGRADVNAKFTATNGIGESSESTSGSGGFIAEVPDPPTTLEEDHANTHTSQVSLTWVAPIDDGGTAIIDYKVFWDQGSNNFEELTGATALTDTRYTKSGLIMGTTYVFKV